MAMLTAEYMAMPAIPEHAAMSLPPPTSRRRRKFVLIIALVTAAAALAFLRWPQPLADRPLVLRVASQLSAQSHAHVPVVLLHGVMDASTNRNMAALCDSVTATHAHTYVLCSSVGDGWASLTPLAQQVEAFAASVRADARLADGFDALGLSQGSLVLRAYAQQHNAPHVRQLLTVCGPHGGIGECPSSVQGWLCGFWASSPYTAPIAFADYWRGTDRAEYLARSRWLADVNNEGGEKNGSYARNMRALERYVLVKASDDHVVVPAVSAQHGYWRWGTREEVPLRETEGYLNDDLGLRTLEESGRLDVLEYEGEHMEFHMEYWQSTILPYLGRKWPVAKSKRTE